MALVCCPHCGHASRDAEFCDACNREIGETSGTTSAAPTQIDLGDGQVVDCPFLKDGWPDSDRLEPFEVAWQKPHRGRLYAISPRLWPSVQTRIEERQRVQSPGLPPIVVVPAEEGAIVVAEWLDHGQLLGSVPAITTEADFPLALREIVSRCQLLGGLMAELHASGFVWLNFDPAAVEVQGDASRIINLDTGLFRIGECPSQLRISPQYSPPEVCRFQGERIGPATDVFHLAMFAYYAIANLLPAGLAGLGLEACGFKVPAVRIFQPALPVGIWPVIARALSTDPGNRFATVEEFLKAFQKSVAWISRGDRPDCAGQPVVQTVRQRRFQKVAADIRRFARACRTQLKGRVPPGPSDMDVGSLTIAGAAKTALGAVNQDMLAVDSLAIGDRTVQLMVVADGVSVSRIGRGEIASLIAVEVIADVIRRESSNAVAQPEWRLIFEQACLEASEQILQRARVELAGQAAVNDNDVMSTTVVIGVRDGRVLHLANAGDSRAYMVRRGLTEQLTVDGDMGTSQLAAGMPPEQVQELGVAAKSLRYCLGACSLNAANELVVNVDRCRPAYSSWVLEPDDKVVICSDGLVEEGVFLEPEDLGAIVAAGAELSAQQLAETLVAEADRRQRVPSSREPAGFGDNIACIVLRVGK